MEAFKRNPITITELTMWKSNSLVNPRTSRDIKENGKLYNYIKNEYSKQFPTLIKINDSIDDKDPISLVTFWIIENEIKKVVYEDISKLILYKDSKGFIRCFERESLEYLKAHKITKHPVSSEEIPKEILDLVVEKNLDKEREDMTIKDKAFEVFQHFSKISIFIDHEWFINLEKSQLLKFNFELTEFYINNFTTEQRKNISEKPLFGQKEKTLSKDEIITYLLRDMNILLSIERDELKYMANYIIVGALGIVIPEIREMYPDFCFSF